MELAALFPARVRSLVLSNTAAQFATHDFWRQRMSRAQTEGVASLLDDTLKRWIVPEHLVDAHVITLLTNMLEHVELAGYLQCCDAVMNFDFTSRLRLIHVPTLIIAGPHDLATTPQQARQLHAGIQQSTYLELPVAHLGNLGAPDVFTEAVLSFAKNH